MKKETHGLCTIEKLVFGVFLFFFGINKTIYWDVKFFYFTVSVVCVG